MALNERKIAFIGAGHITNILLDNLSKAGKLSAHIPVVGDPDKNKLQQLSEKHKITMARNVR